MPNRTSNDAETRLLMDEDPDEVNVQVSEPPQRSTSTTNLTDFMFIKIIARIFLGLLRKFWALSSAAFLAIVLFYWLCGGLAAFLLVTFAITGVLYHSTDRLLYHPNQPQTARVFVPSPSIVNLPFESVYIKSKDKTRIHLFLIKVAPEIQASAPTVLFLHGNAGNIGHRLLNVKGIHANLECNVCLVEYRGYGRSDGSPSEEGLYMDAQAGLDYLCSRKDINPNRIIVFGRSLGGAVAIELASRSENRDKIGCLVVENTFTSIPDIAKALFDFRIVKYLPHWCYKNQFKSKQKACRISVPALFISGTADSLIPPKMMTDLYHSCGSEAKRLARFKGGTHNETWTMPKYYQAFRYFVQEVARMQHPTNVEALEMPNVFETSSSVI